MKDKIKDALISGAVYIIGIGAIALILFWPQISEGAGTFDIGGKLDDGDLSVATSLDYSWPAGKFERDIEFDYRYKELDEHKNTNKGLIAFKQRYEFKPKHYAFGLVRYDYNEFRPINHRRQVNIGWGYKLIRSENIKMSNEFAVGYLNSKIDTSPNSENEILFRNSLWFFYKLAPKLNFTNKFLYEASNTPLIRNEASFNYLLTDKIKISLKDVYTEDPHNKNYLSFNVGYTF
jgi:putative salt-induced outer membrane protein YdiY